MTVETLAAIAAVWAAAAGCVELEALRRLAFARRRSVPAGAARAARVLVIRPCTGRDPWLGEALASLSGARRSFTIACRLAVADAADAAFPIATKAAASLTDAGLDARVVLTAPPGPNRKAAQLAAVIAAERAPFDVVLVADADVDLGGAELDRLVAPLAARPELGAVWAPPVEASDRTLGDRASAALLSASLHAFPILAKLDRDSLVGKLFAVRRDALVDAGGFDALTAYLGEDMELSRRLRACGLGVEAAAMPARSLSSGRTWAEAEERFARWIKVIRAQRPILLASYPLLFFATVPIVALAALASPGSPLLSAVVAAASIALRLAVAFGAAVASGRRRSLHHAAADAMLADAMLASAYVRALRSRKVVWRDAALRIERGGLLRAAEEKRA